MTNPDWGKQEDKKIKRQVTPVADTIVAMSAGSLLQPSLDERNYDDVWSCTVNIVVHQIYTLIVCSCTGVIDSRPPGPTASGGKKKVMK